MTPLFRILLDLLEAHGHPEAERVWGLLRGTLAQRKDFRDPMELTREEGAEVLLWAVLDRLVQGWDRYGAPTAARVEEGRFVGSFERPGEPYTVEASSKREALRAARWEWFRRILEE